MIGTNVVISVVQPFSSWCLADTLEYNSYILTSMMDQNVGICLESWERLYCLIVENHFFIELFFNL